MARSTLHKWFSFNRLISNRHGQCRTAIGDRLHRRLRVEPLEDRRLLAIMVDTLVDEADGSITDGDVSLRDAIALAPANETIDFAPALTSNGPTVIQLTDVGHVGEIVINRNVTINGPGASLLTIQAFDPTPEMNNGDGSRIFNIDDGTSALRTVVISGLKLTGGDIGGDGGAISSIESLTVASCTIVGNSARDGGGVRNNGGNLTVTGSTISGNSAGFDGGGINSLGDTAVTGSTISSNTAADAGGGISHLVGTLTVTDSSVDGNNARGTFGRQYPNKGGGIYSGTNLTLVRSKVTGNMAGYRWVPFYVENGGYGGGIYATGSLTISKSTISDNTAEYAWDWRSEWGAVAHYGGNGGGIAHVHGAATITGSEISNNQARWAGGGIGHYDGPLSVTDSTISGNRGNFQGGGIYSISRSTSPSSTSLSIDRSTISDNSTGSYGGGIWSQGGNLTITSSTISGNVALTPKPDTTPWSRAIGYGGGVYSDDLTSTISHSTITQNSAGILGGGIQAFGSMAIGHTIVAENTHGEVPVPDDVSGSVEVSLSLVGVDSGATIIDKGGNRIGAAAAPIDPLLAPLADNGGPTRTHALLAGSPAIDAVDPAAVAGIAGNVVSANLGTSAYSASHWAQWMPGAAPQFAFDGIVAAGWDAGNYPVPMQWIEVDLQQPQTLTGFQLYVDQSPAGNTVHEVWVSNSPIQNNLSAATLIHTFAGFTADQDVLSFALPSAVTARFVQIRTTQSPSWVGWDEVQVFAGDIPQYDQRGAPFGRGVGGRMDMGAFESQPMPPADFGDYNQNGAVDGADYVVWRRAKGQTVAPYSGADGNGDRVVDEADYAVWRAHFGMTLSAPAAGSSAAVEPAAIVMQSALAEPLASSVEHVELEQRASFGLAGASERDAALAVLDPRLPLFAPRGLNHRRPLVVVPSAGFGAVGRRYELPATYSDLAVVDQLASEHAQDLRPIKRSAEKQVELREEALEAAFASLDARSTVTGLDQLTRKQI